MHVFAGSRTGDGSVCDAERLSKRRELDRWRRRAGDERLEIERIDESGRTFVVRARERSVSFVGGCADLLAAPAMGVAVSFSGALTMCLPTGWSWSPLFAKKSFTKLTVSASTRTNAFFFLASA